MNFRKITPYVVPSLSKLKTSIYLKNSLKEDNSRIHNKEENPWSLKLSFLCYFHQTMQSLDINRVL